MLIQLHEQCYNTNIWPDFFFCGFKCSLKCLKSSAECLKGLIMCFETNTWSSPLINEHIKNFKVSLSV